MLFSPLPLVSALLTCSLLANQEPVQIQAPTEGVETDTEPEVATPSTPAWFGRLEDARVEAARTGRPILLMSAAPQCSGAPGMW